MMLLNAGVENVAGNMLEKAPSGNAILIKVSSSQLSQRNKLIN
jgi:hypothetical protein